MNFRNIFNKTETRELTGSTLTPPSILGTYNFFSGLSGSLLGNAAVIRSMSAISSSIASMKINEYRVINGEKQEIDSNVEYLLNCAPNQFQSAYNFKKVLIENVFQSGNALVKINRDINNNILSLIILNSSYFTCNYNITTCEPTYYYQGKVLDMSEFLLIYFYPDANFGGFFGKNLVKYASSVLNKARNVESFQDNFFVGGGAVAGVLTPRSTDNGGRAMTVAQANKAKDAFLTQTQSNINGVVMLDADLQYQKISTNAKDSQLLEVQDFNVLEISRIMNIPASYLFKSDKEITEQDQITFYTQTLQPLITLIENELQRKLFFKTEYRSRKIEFDYESLIKSSRATQADYYTKLFNLGVVSPNEICRKLNLPISSERGSNDRFILQNAQPLKLNLNEVKAEKNNQ